MERLVLHLHDDVLTAFRLTEDVVYQRTVSVRDAKLFLVEILHIDYMVLVLQKGIQEGNKHWLRHFLAEDALETDVRKRIDELSHNRIAFDNCCKDSNFILNCQIF